MGGKQDVVRFVTNIKYGQASMYIYIKQSERNATKLRYQYLIINLKLYTSIVL